MKHPKVATEDIEVYKRVKVSVTKQDIAIYTPFRCTIIPTIPYRFVAEGEEIIGVHDCYGFYGISAGFIHAYKNITLAFEDCSITNVVVKAIIPAGIPFFENRYEICAKEMYLQGVILDEDNYVSTEIFEYLDPSIPILKFDVDTATFKQINLSINEEIKEEKLEEELVYV